MATIPIASASKSPLSVKENTTAYLWCNATGVPEPAITWYMIDQESNKTEQIGKSKISIPF